jgi:predicted histidine transporter YuiF (NhaC family)
LAVKFAKAFGLPKSVQINRLCLLTGKIFQILKRLLNSEIFLSVGLPCIPRNTVICSAALVVRLLLSVFIFWNKNIPSRLEINVRDLRILNMQQTRALDRGHFSALDDFN